MGVKSRSTQRRRKGSIKASRSFMDREELQRRIQLALLNSSMQQRVGALLLFVILAAATMASLGAQHHMLEAQVIDVEESKTPVIQEEAETAEELLARLRRSLGGFGQTVLHEEVALQKAGERAVEIFISPSKLDELEKNLWKIEREATKGWNVSEPNVQPLGQLGYVKRDLPVYKEGLNKLNSYPTVLSRPKSGLFSVDQLAGDTYNMIMCLSFNTDHCFDPDQHHMIHKSKRVNRIQNLRDTIWSKHKFCRTMSQSTKGLLDQDLISFTFPCWVMPQDYDRMIKYSRTNNINTWIAKPRSLGAGMGIYVVTSLDDLEHEKSTSNVVQTYLEEPHLIEKVGLDGTVNKYKWDMRSYVLVTSVTPLRAYLYSRGLVRISTSPYTKDCKGNITACLTNTSLNKKVEGANLKDITWSFKKLSDYLDKSGGPTWGRVFERMQRAVGMTLLSSESELLKHFTPKGFRCENCYQLLGVDLLFDEAMQPKVVEVNGEPNLKTTSSGRSHYDITKKNMARDLVALVFSANSQRDDVADRLYRWANAVAAEEEIAEGKKPSSSVPLGEDALRYILATMREHRNIGGFAPVYPEPKLAEVYGRYLRFLRDKESKQGPDDLAVHGDGRRYRLHQVITLLQNKEALGAVKIISEPNSSNLRASSSSKKNKAKNGQTSALSKKTPQVGQDAGDEDVF
mmetsp:Transcript_13308/g.23660  ORF Transcript_13308/g.23660 Transcript_13308/m.23660 type:complete len:685 (-) Transcript_13308:355-2409(-)